MKQRIYIFILVLFFLSSCATKTKVEYRDHDITHYITNVVHDTLVDRTTDSVYFETLIRGDTVFQTKYKERTRWKERVVERHDTCWKDSVVMEYKETIKEITKIPKIYKVSLIISILLVIFAIIKIIRYIQIH